jgi:hypothetical protein
MMDVQVEGREVRVRLMDDVFQMEEPGTVCLTMKQAQVLRRALNALNHLPVSGAGTRGWLALCWESPSPHPITLIILSGVHEAQLASLMGHSSHRARAQGTR